MIARDQLRSIFDRWSRLEGEKAMLTEDLKELFAEAKGNGYDPKALRIAFRTKVKAEAETDADRETAALVDTYLSALGTNDAITRASRARNPGDALPPAGHSDLPAADSDRSPTGDRREAGGATTAPAGRAAEESPATLPDEYVERHERISAVVRAFNEAPGERLNEIARARRDRDMPPIPAFLDRTGAA